MVCPAPPGYLTPDPPVAIPDCCAWPPPSALTLGLNVQRNNAEFCTDAALTPESAALTFDGVSQYTGTFTYLGDIFDVTLTFTGGIWYLQMSSATIGCGFGALSYSESGFPLTGTWPDATPTGPGVCGCGSLWFAYTSVVVA